MNLRFNLIWKFRYAMDLIIVFLFKEEYLFIAYLLKLNGNK